MGETTEAAAKPEIEQLTLRIAKPAFAELRATAQRKGVTVNEFVRRAIGTELFIEGQIAEGARILIEHPKSKRNKELVLR